MTNLDFLRVGEYYPPLDEAKRIGDITEYNLMYDGHSYAIETKRHKEVLRRLNSLAALLGWGEYITVSYNYFQLITLKTHDFTVGETPSISFGDKQETGDEIRKLTQFDEKLGDAFIDLSKYGEVFLRVYRDMETQRNNFTLQNNAFVFRIRDPQTVYATKAYVVAFISGGGTTLTAQIHYKGYYEEKIFAVERAQDTGYLKNSKRYAIADVQNTKTDLFTLIVDRFTDEIFRYTPYKIKAETSFRIVDTHLDDFAIISMTNTMNSTHEFGVSDYERIESIVTDMEGKIAEVGMLLDKFTVPTMYGDVSVLAHRNERGDYSDGILPDDVMNIGMFHALDKNSVIPGFVEPDISKVQQYYNAILNDVERLKELSEMGAAISSDISASSVSTKTMRMQFFSAIKKSERLTSRNTAAVKKLFHLLSQSPGVETIGEDEISITWYDGLPNDEMDDVEISTAKINAGLSTVEKEFIERFDHTQEEFDEHWTKWMEEQADINSSRAASMGGDPYFGTQPTTSPGDSQNEVKE